MLHRAMNKILVISSLLMFGLAGQSQAQEDQKIAGREIQATQNLERVVNKLQAYQTGAEGIDAIGSLTGLWRVKSGVNQGKTPIRQVYHLRDVLTYSYVDQESGKLTIIGFAEQVNNQWQGWMKLVCRDCCPGTSWWDQGVLSAGQGSAHIAIKSLKMDPVTGVFSPTRPTIFVSTLSFSACFSSRNSCQES